MRIFISEECYSQKLTNIKLEEVLSNIRFFLYENFLCLILDDNTKFKTNIKVKNKNKFYILRFRKLGENKKQKELRGIITYSFISIKGHNFLGAFYNGIFYANSDFRGDILPQISELHEYINLINLHEI